MAGEYSRELSAKVYAGQKRLIGLGFRQGGMAGYGLRRMRLDAMGTPLGLLSRGQLKGVTTDRVILVHGPDAEVKVVRAMFRDFIAGESTASIARRLNDKGITNSVGTPWTGQIVKSLLTNEKYIGNNVYGKTCGTLHQRRFRMPESDWVRKYGAFEPVISMRVFKAAKQSMKLRNRRLSDEQVLAPLRGILSREGRISTRLIQAAADTQAIPTLVRRFGGLRQVYDLIGFKAGKSLLYADARLFLRDAREHTSKALMQDLASSAIAVVRHAWRMTIYRGLTLSVTTLRTSLYRNVDRWYVRQIPEETDLVLFVRMSGDGTTVKDYVLWPWIVYRRFPKDVSTRELDAIAAYTFSSLGDVVRVLRCGPRLGAHGFPPEGTVEDETLSELIRECGERCLALDSALKAVDTYRRHVPPDAVSTVSDGHSIDDLLRFVVLSGRSRGLLLDGDLAGWLARHHPRELAILQNASRRVGIRDLRP